MSARVAPPATLIWACTRSMPVTSSVTVCSTYIQIITSIRSSLLSFNSPACSFVKCWRNEGRLTPLGLPIMLPIVDISPCWSLWRRSVPGFLDWPPGSRSLHSCPPWTPLCQHSGSWETCRVSLHSHELLSSPSHPDQKQARSPPPAMLCAVCGMTWSCDTKSL